jgi:tetratricopeptide (TPR) repeat protein
VKYFKEDVMWKKIGLVILGLVIGFVFGFILSMAYSGYTLATGMVFFQGKEIIDMGQAAEDAYYNEPNEAAVWALTKYIEILNETKEWQSSAKVKKSPFYIDPNHAFFLSHARLGKIYKRMGKTEESRYHFEQAITHSKSRANTEEDCLKTLDALDKLHDKGKE